MAKQSGIHQIKGKIGEHSYYRQSGVASGLIRRINQGMSNRVKTGEEFANTRLNNYEFKVAANMAKAFGAMIVPKYRPMLLVFSQSKLTKSFLELIKTNAGNWGARYLKTANNSQMLDAVNSLAKNSFDETIGTVAVQASEVPDNTSLEIILPVDMQQALASLGVSGVSIRVQARSVYGAKYTDDTFSGYIGQVSAPDSEDQSLDLSDDINYTFTLPVPTSPAWTEADRVFTEVSVVAMPYRTINGEKHILQELCSFKIVEAVVS